MSAACVQAIRDLIVRYDTGLRVAGDAIGDPRAESGPIIPSPLIYIDPEGGWVASQNTLYALRPA